MASFTAQNAKTPATRGARRERVTLHLIAGHPRVRAAGARPIALGTRMGMTATSKVGARNGFADPMGGRGSSMMHRERVHPTPGSGISDGVIFAIVLGALVLLLLAGTLTLRRAPCRRLRSRST